jgi:hypothetical protein
MHRIPQFINNAGVPPTAHQVSPGSSMSPLGSDTEPFAVADGEISTPLRNGNGALDTPNHIDPGSPTSLGQPPLFLRRQFNATQSPNDSRCTRSRRRAILSLWFLETRLVGLSYHSMLVS